MALQCHLSLRQRASAARVLKIAPAGDGRGQWRPGDGGVSWDNWVWGASSTPLCRGTWGLRGRPGEPGEMGLRKGGGSGDRGENQSKPRGYLHKFQVYSHGRGEGPPMRADKRRQSPAARRKAISWHCTPAYPGVPEYTPTPARQPIVPRLRTGNRWSRGAGAVGTGVSPGPPSSAVARVGGLAAAGRRRGTCSMR